MLLIKKISVVLLICLLSFVFIFKSSKSSTFSNLNFAINDNQFLYVVNQTTNSVMIFEQYGNCFKDIELNKNIIKSITDISACPCGGYILIADKSGRKVYSIDDSNKDIKHKIDISEPTKVAISKNRLRYEGIINQANNTLNLYMQNGTFIRKINLDISANKISNIHIDEFNNIWICNYVDKEIIELDLKGKVILKINNNSEYGFTGPIAIQSGKSGLIFVLDKNKYIYNFTRDGSLITKRDLKSFLTSEPLSFALDHTNNLFWISLSNGSLLKFNMNYTIDSKIIDVYESKIKKVIYLKIGSTVAEYVGKETILMDVAPYIDNKTNKTLVPLRVISDIFKAKIQWEGSTRKIIIELDGKKIVMTIGRKEVYINDKLSIIDIPPVINNGRTLVPVRFISEQLNSEVLWIQDEKRIIITKLNN